MRILSALLGLVGAVLWAVPAGAQSSDWTTYHHDALRTADGDLSGTFTSLAHPAWTWKVPGPTSADDLYSEPLIANNLVIVTSEDNWVYALKASTGALVWKRQVGTPETPAAGVCGDIATPAQPTIGITSTPVIDESRGELYVVAAIGTGPGNNDPVRHLFGLSLKNGHVELDRNVEPGGVSNTYEFQRASLAED